MTLYPRFVSILADRAKTARLTLYGAGYFLGVRLWILMPLSLSSLSSPSLSPAAADPSLAN